MATGYEDIDKLTEQQSTMLDESLKQQQDIVNKQTQMNVDALEKNKAEIDQQTTKTNQGLYSDYKKASNPYGVNAEQTYAKGLGNSGYAETTQTNLYNTYQKNVTDTVNNAQKLKADFDFQISQARQNGDITLAQNALQIYMQKMQLLTQEYELRNNREQYLYQKEQDALAQSNWEKEYAYQQERDAVADNQWQQSFDYNKSRDEVADSQWQQSFDYNKSRDEVSDNQWQQSFDYQKGRDQVSDSQWQQSFDYTKSRDAVSDQQYAEQMAYQKERDAVSDSQWAKEYALSKSTSGYSNGLVIPPDDEGGDDTTKLSSNGEEIYKSAQGIYNSQIAKNGEANGKSRDSYVISYLRNLYGTNQLSETDLRIIIDKMGLE